MADAAARMRCARFIVSGTVQGVCFRAGAREQALRLRLNGYARNLPDGNVEVLACGDAAALATLEDWLQVGPPAAQVRAVERIEASAPDTAGFRIL